MPPNFPLVILDTNVYISGTTISASPPSHIIQAWEDDKIKLVLSEPILDEIRGVLSKPYFQAHLNWSPEKVNKYIDNLRLSAIVVPGTTPVNVCPDPNDNMLFSCALETNSDYIVSGDKAVLAVKQFKNTLVLSPRSFVNQVLTTLQFP